MIISFIIFSIGKTASQIHNEHQNTECIEIWATKLENIEESLKNARFSRMHKYANNKTYHRNSYTTIKDHKAKLRRIHLTENTQRSFLELLLHNEKDSFFLDIVLVTTTDDIVGTVEKLKNFSNVTKYDCEDDFKNKSEEIQERLNETIRSLQADWNTLNVVKKEKICKSKCVIKEILKVKYILYKLIEIFCTVRYQINLFCKEDIHQQDEDFHSLFIKLFLERFSVYEPVKYFKNLEEFITCFSQSLDN